LTETIGFQQMYSFIYSPRPNTEALHFVDDIPAQEKSRRLAYLQNRQREIQIEKAKSMIGRTVEVLVDGTSAKDENTLAGRTSTNYVVNFNGPRSLLGRYVPVRIIRSGANSLVGDAVECPPRGNIIAQSPIETDREGLQPGGPYGN
jgi:tRNA-2-methylthio-N6-dimethylallyladenosine synthase